MAAALRVYGWIGIWVRWKTELQRLGRAPEFGGRQKQQ